MSSDQRAVGTAAQLMREACTDLERRLRAGEACAAEDWFTAHPDLAALPEYALELIYAEFVLREQLGQRPTPEAWYARFPQWQADLRQLFQVHHLALANVKPETARTVAEGPGQMPSASPPGVAVPGSRLGNYE